MRPLAPVDVALVLLEQTSRVVGSVLARSKPQERGETSDRAVMVALASPKQAGHARATVPAPS